MLAFYGIIFLAECILVSSMWSIHFCHFVRPQNREKKQKQITTTQYVPWLPSANRTGVNLDIALTGGGPSICWAHQHHPRGVLFIIIQETVFKSNVAEILRTTFPSKEPKLLSFYFMNPCLYEFASTWSTYVTPLMTLSLLLGNQASLSLCCLYTLRTKYFD